MLSGDYLKRLNRLKMGKPLIKLTEHEKEQIITIFETCKDNGVSLISKKLNLSYHKVNTFLDAYLDEKRLLLISKNK